MADDERGYRIVRIDFIIRLSKQCLMDYISVCVCVYVRVLGK